MSNKTFILLKGATFRNSKNIFKNPSYVFLRDKHYDIAIAGGGLVGTSVACAVATNKTLSDREIILFESSPQRIIQKKSENDDYSNRVVSLNPGTRKFLESLGVWKHISNRYKTVKKMQVWDACSDSLITFNDDLVNDVSYIVENDLLLYALQQVSSDHEKSITIKYESKIKEIKLAMKNKPVQLEMENGEKHTCDLLIGADGFNSKTRQAIGCQYLSWDYNQKGVVATLQLSEPTENVVAWQRFLPTGPVALLPLTNELSSLVWSTGIKEAEHLLKLTDEEFVDAVNDAFWKNYPKNSFVSSVNNTVNKVLESLSLISNVVRQLPPSVKFVGSNSRAAFPLGFGHSTKYVSHGVALVGDAAHRVHPLAGQGVNLGFGDVECLINILVDSVYNGNKLGCIRALANYESERQKQLIPILSAIDILQKLYTTSFTPIVVLRSVGLQITNALTPVKKLIVDRASA